MLSANSAYDGNEASIDDHHMGSAVERLSYVSESTCSGLIDKYLHVGYVYLS